MDLRRPVLAILVGGSPAPGINSVICATTIEAINAGCDVIGIMEGYKRLREGKSKTINLTTKEVLKIQTQGGSLLRTSKMHPTTAEEVDNVLRVLELLRVRYLVTIGGVITAQSSNIVAAAAKAAKVKLSIVHVPKTIFNDIPLPGSARTFGFNTARQVGHSLVQMFAADAATMVRWYVLTCVGVQSGHLTLGIGKSAAANLTIIPEQFIHRKGHVTFTELVDMVEASIYKRRADDMSYGIAMLCEGLVDQMDPKEVKELFGNVDDGHQDLGRVITVELQKRFKKVGLDITTIARNIGTECRAADPSSEDILLSRDLGYGAARYLMEGGSGAMVSLRGSKIQPIPFSDMIDEKTGVPTVRLVNTKGVAFVVAQNYMTKLKKSDLTSRSTLAKLAEAANVKPEEFATRFGHVAEDDSSASTIVGAMSSGMKGEDSVIAEVSRGYVSPPSSNPHYPIKGGVHKAPMSNSSASASGAASPAASGPASAAGTPGSSSPSSPTNPARQLAKK